MAIAFKRYLVCLGAVCALMAVYCATVVPILQPPPRDTIDHRASGDDIKPNVWWHHLFAEDSWQNNNPMVLQTEQGTLLFRSLEQLGPNQWRLAPLSLVVPMSRESRTVVVGDVTAAAKVYQDSPLAVVVAQDGADIQFREAPDWTSGSTPPLTGGLLRGPIEITGIDPKRGTGPQWSIRTANLRIDRRHVWTNNEVQITTGNSRAIGKDLSIFLKQDLLGPSSDENGPWGLLDHMELIYVKQVSVDLPPGGLWKGMKLGSETIAAAQAKIPARMELTCQGSFKFDFNESTAKLSDHIRLEHRFANDPAADEFLCHELTASFAVPDPTRPADPNAIMVGPMQLTVVDAIGIDSADPLPPQATVQINAPNIGTQLTAKHLHVQLEKRHFAVESPASVYLSYMGNVFRAPLLEYAAAPNAEHLGWLFASGPGEVETDASSEFGRATARWNKSLKMQPSESGQVVAIDGRALLEAEARGHLASEHIDVSLVPISHSPGYAESSSEANSPSKMSAKPMQIDRLDASGDVVMGNQAQNVRVSQLHIQFVYPPKSTPSSTHPDSVALSNSSGQSASPRIMPPADNLSAATLPTLLSQGQPPLATNPRPGTFASTSLPSAATRDQPTQSDASAVPPPIGLPAASRARNTSASPDTLKSPAGNLPVLILGTELHSQVIVTGEQSWIDHLQITGPVVISRDGPPLAGDPAWRIEGGQLQLTSGASGQVDLQIVGEPARVTFGEGYIEGPVIRMDQRTGLVWMDHPGEICIPGNLIGSSATVPGTGPNIEWLRPLKCRWQGHMLFNGTKANIDGNITLDGCARTAPDRLLFIGGSCNAIEMLMTKAIDISSPGTTTASVHSLTMKRNVNIRTAQRDTQNRRISLEEISVPELTYELATNRVIGSGPGWLRSQHVSSGGGLGAAVSGGGSAPLANTLVSSAPSATVLQGMHLKFRDTMEARLTEKQLSFLGRVEVGIGPVASLEDVINLDTMRTLQPEQMLLGGDLLRIYDASDLSQSPTANPSTMAEGAWEFEAMGNVTFEGNRESGEFAGKAYRMTYAQSKDLLHIRGDARVPAELQYRPRTSSVESTTLKLWAGSLNTKTMRPSADADGQLELAPGSQVVPRRAAGATEVTPPPAGPSVRPRDAATDLFKRN